ncbi:MAG: hypothetical protein AB8G16_08515 [Gammaproteobacteria bacterium]
MLIGAVVGSAVAVLGLLAARAFTPSLHVASVLMVVSDRPAVFDDNDEALRAAQRDTRDTLTKRVSDPKLLPRIVRENQVPKAAAAEFSRTVRSQALEERPSFVALTAESHDPQALAVLLDATVESLLQADARRALLAQDDQITALNDLEAQVVEEDRVAQQKLIGVKLPPWARASATALGLLDARIFSVSLAPYLGRPPTMFEAMEMIRTQRDIDVLMQSIGGTPAVTAGHFAAARQRASTAARRAHLVHTRQNVLELDPGKDGLQVIQFARPVPVPPPRRRMLWIALVGGSLGALAGFLRFMGRPEGRKSRDGPTLESHVHVRVLGTMASALVDYAQRKHRPLAQTHPDHLAVEAVRSLATALTITAASSSRTGPVIMVNADSEQNAGHVLANLAMLAAVRNERVLLIDTQGEGSVLGDLFTTGTRTLLSTSVDVNELEDALPKRKSGGRIRYVVAENSDTDDPPVPGAFASYFDRIYIRAHSIERAARLASCYDGAAGVLVGHHSMPIRDWQEARDKWRDASDSLIGLVQCGHTIEERLYVQPIT